MDRSTARSVWIGLGLVAIVLLVASSWGGGMMFGRGLGVPFGPFGYRPFVAPWLFGMWGIGLLVRLVFFGLVAFLVVRLFRGRRSSYRRGYYDSLTRTHDYPQQTPDEILRRRYAAGDISREQYEEMRRTLEPVA
jgi:putative membrane protein